MRNSPDAAAQKMGFADAKTLHAVVQIGQQLKAGKQITNSMVDTLAGAYPAIPKNVIYERAVAVNQLPPAQRFNAFATEVGGPESVQQASALVESYGQNLTRETFTDDLSSRLDARQTVASKAMTVPQVDHRSDLRKSLEAQFKQPLPANLATARRMVADGAEKNLQTLSDPKASLRDHVAASYDKPMIEDAMEAVLTDDDREQLSTEAHDDQWVEV